MNFMEWINLGTAITGIAQTLIKQHETPGHGEQKKKAVVQQVISIVGAALTGISATNSPVPVTENDKQIVEEMTGQIVDTQVGLLNQTGEFPQNVTSIKVKKAVALSEIQKGDAVAVVPEREGA